MKVKLIIIFFAPLFFASFSESGLRAQNNLSVVIQKMIVGKWVLSSDRKFIIDIHEDSIIYAYDGKISDKRASKIILGDSLSYYRLGENDFNFMRSNGEIYQGIVINEYDSFYKDTIINTVVYINKNGMDLILGNKDASFKKMKKKASE